MANEPTIEQMNEVICKFMGGHRMIGGTIHVYKGPDGIEWETGQYLKYHTSWDWLMPVWIKWRHTVSISKDSEEWTESLGYYLLTSDEPKRFFERMFYAIQWLNQQKQKDGTE